MPKYSWAQSEAVASERGQKNAIQQKFTTVVFREINS